MMRLLVPAIVLCLPALAHAEVVDRVLYVVEDQLVLQSDIVLDQALQPLDKSPSPFWDRPGVTAEQRVLDATALRLLAGSTGIYQPSEEQLRERIEVVRSAFVDRGAWEEFLEGWGIEEATVASILRRRLIVERYLARNIAVPATDREEWWTQVNLMLTELRPRLRIRRIEP